MDFKIFYHDIFEKHIVPDGHPERSDRIKTLNKLLIYHFKPYLKKRTIKFNSDFGPVKYNSKKYI